MGRILNVTERMAALVRSRALVIFLLAVAAAFALPSFAYARAYYPAEPYPAVTSSMGTPVSIAVAPDGERFLADQSGARIVVLSAAGTYLREFNGSDAYGQRLVSPVSVVLDANGYVHVVDETLDRVLVFTRAGAFVRHYGTAVSFSGIATTPLNAPSDVAFDAAGNAYVGERASSRVVAFKPDGTYLRAINRPFSGYSEGGAYYDYFHGTSALAVSPNGYLFIAEQQSPFRMFMYTVGGNPISTWDYQRWPALPGNTEGQMQSRYVTIRDLAVAPQGLMISTFMFTDYYGTVAEWGIEYLDVLNGEYSTYWDVKPFFKPFAGDSGSTPQGMCVLNGRLFVTDASSATPRIVEYDIASDYLKVAETRLTPSSAPSVTVSPRGVATLPGGGYVVADGGALKRYTDSGSYVASLVTTQTVPGFSPVGVAVSQATSELYVTDSAAGMVRVFALDGTPVRSFGGIGADPGSMSDPAGLAIGAGGVIAVADTGNDRVQVLSADDGAVLAVVSSALPTSSPLADPEGVAFDPDSGELLVADTGNHRILRFEQVADPLSAPLSERWVLSTALPTLIASQGTNPGTLSWPVAVAAASGGETLVLERGTNRLQRFAADGSSVSCSGASGSGVGALLAPGAMAVRPDGSVLIADTGNRRVVGWKWDETAPVTEVAGSLWAPTRGPVTVSLTASDAQSGVGRIMYRVDTGPATAYTGPVTFTAEGEYIFWYWSEDLAGNVEAKRDAPVRIDLTPPSGTTVLKERVGGSVPPTVTILSDIYDTPAQFNSSIEMRYDIGLGFTPWESLQTSVPVYLSKEGTATIRVVYRDSASNVATRTFGVYRDTLPPTSTISGGPVSGVASGPAQLTISAIDVRDKAPIIEYELDGGGFATYTGPVQVSSEGSHTVRYRSRDEIGNTEALKEYSFAIDSRKPGGEFELLAPGVARRSRVISVVSSITPAARMRFDTGSGYSAWVPYSAVTTVGVSADGTRTITAQYESLAGLSATRTITLFIDSQAPTLVERPVKVTAFRYSGARLDSFDLVFSAMAADRGAPPVGLAGLAWSVGSRRAGVDTATASAEMTSVPAGLHPYSARSYDYFGNVNQHTAAFSLGRAFNMDVPLSARSGSAFQVSATIPGSSVSGVRASIGCYRKAENGRWVYSRSFATTVRVDGTRAVASARPVLPAGEWRFLTQFSGLESGPVVGIPSGMVTVR